MNVFDIHFFKKSNINYWAITKCASTTFRTYFKSLEENLDIYIVTERFKKKGHKGIGTHHYQISITEALKNNATHVTILREPIFRFESMYRDLFFLRKERGEQAVKTKNIKNIDDFSRYLLETSDEDLDIHFQPQVNFLYNSISIQYMRLEFLEQDWFLPIPIPTYSLHTTKKTIQYKISDKIKNRVYQRYAEDFKLYNSIDKN